MGIRIGAVAVDCPDPAGLAEFYQNVLGVPVVMSTPELVVIGNSGVLLSFEKISAHRAPTWPSGQIPKQLHLDLAVDDLEAEERRIVALGAKKAAVQPDPEKWRVLIDPAGHPFCITILFG